MDGSDCTLSSGSGDSDDDSKKLRVFSSMKRLKFRYFVSETRH